MTDLCAQAIENMECQPEPGRGVGRGRARVSRALGGGTPPLRQSRPEKPAQPFEKAQNRLGSGRRPKPRPGRSPCHLCSTRNAGWAWPSCVGGRASRAPWAAGRRPSDRAARKSWRNPLKTLKTGSGLAGDRSRDLLRAGSIALPSLVSSKRRLGVAERRLTEARPGPMTSGESKKAPEALEKAQNGLGNGKAPQSGTR